MQSQILRSQKTENVGGEGETNGVLIPYNANQNNKKSYHSILRQGMLYVCSASVKPSPAIQSVFGVALGVKTVVRIHSCFHVGIDRLNNIQRFY